MISLCSSGWPRTHHEDLVDLKLIEIPLPLLGLKMCITIPGYFLLSLLKQDLAMQPRLVTNMLSSCPRLANARIMGVSFVFETTLPQN